MTNADKRVADRLMHGNCTVNTRSAGGSTLYQDLYDLLKDQADLRNAVAHLASVVNRDATVTEAPNSKTIAALEEGRTLLARSER